MNIALWIIQIIIAVFFLTTGSLKLVLPKENLRKVFEWIEDFTEQRLRLIGAFEVLGGLGLFLPGVYSTFEILIPLAAIGLTIIMVLATFLHSKRKETKEVILNIVILVFLVLIVAGRLFLVRL
ncbi:DoxX family protein [Draconibacterium halophilum]|uniref:DoxX family protein n=1 Tax=Draconibacterium halophilum TaxID=2706887 RepID=A0A6C0R9M8_9BACT|nr:DoxX family protein [Draconibacterium halophilum]QIA06869.1 DoxX family protein [Draconibacterium halophilum]